jgi:hypothetical protein
MKRTGKPYEGKPHVRFDEKMLEIGYGWDIVTLSEETERNREYKHQPVATTPVFYSTFPKEINRIIRLLKNAHNCEYPMGTGNLIRC